MSHERSFQIENRLSQLEVAFKALEKFGKDQGLEEDILFDLRLALEEILTNVMAHAYEDEGSHVIRVSISVENGVVTTEVTDTGRPFNPLKIPSLDLKAQFRARKLGGLGFHLVRNVMDHVAYRRENEKNIFIMKKRVSN